MVSSTLGFANTAPGQVIIPSSRFPPALNQALDHPRGQQVLVDAGFVVEAVEVAGGDEVDEVAVAVLVFAEQNEVVIAVGFRANLVAFLRDVDFAADDGVDAFVFGCVVEFDGAEEVAMVGHGDGGHFLFDDQVHELGDFAGSV